MLTLLIQVAGLAVAGGITVTPLRDIPMAADTIMYLDGNWSATGDARVWCARPLSTLHP